MRVLSPSSESSAFKTTSRLPRPRESTSLASSPSGLPEPRIVRATRAYAARASAAGAAPWPASARISAASARSSSVGLRPLERRVAEAALDGACARRPRRPARTAGTPASARRRARGPRPGRSARRLRTTSRPPSRFTSGAGMPCASTLEAEPLGRGDDVRRSEERHRPRPGRRTGRRRSAPPGPAPRAGAPPPRSRPARGRRATPIPSQAPARSGSTVRPSGFTVRSMSTSAPGGTVTSPNCSTPCGSRTWITWCVRSVATPPGCSSTAAASSTIAAEVAPCGRAAS